MSKNAKALDTLEATVELPGGYSATLWYRRGELGCDWAPTLPDEEISTTAEFGEKWIPMRNGFIDAVASLTGMPIVVHGHDGEQEYVGYPLTPADLGYVQ